MAVAWDSPVSYRARWIDPIEGQPLEGGYLTVLDGKIVDVGEAPVGRVVDLGDVVVLPGFVNAHTHLDLSAMRGAIARPPSFPNWLEAVMACRGGISAEQKRAAMAQGVDEMIRSGTTLVGDIAVGPESETFYLAGGLPATVFREVVGLRPQRYEPLWQAALERASELNQTGADRWMTTAGITPHAPYSTAPEVYRRANESLTSEGPVRLATHWFETREELEFLRTGGGPFRDFLEKVGAFPESGAPLHSLDDAWEMLLGAPKGPQWLLAHGNYLSESDIELLASPRGRDLVRGIVYCPRTHAYFGHDDHPWQQLLQAGILVGLGTDSLASNPDLSVFDEAKFLAAKFRLSMAPTILRMLCLGGATALGRADEIGTLAPGKRADLTVVSAPTSTAENLAANLLSADSQVRGTMIGGAWLYGPIG